MARIYLAFAIIVLDVGYLCEFGSYFNFNGVFGTTSSAYFSNAPSLFGDLYYSPFLGMGFIFFHVLLTLLFLVGLKSLSFCFLFFMTTLSIQNYMLSHNIASGADTFTAQILFWFLLTPYNRVLSLNKSSIKEPDNDEVRTIWALYFFIVLVYFLTGILKTGDDWTREFTAIEYTLNSFYASDIGRYLSSISSQGVKNILTHLVRNWELLVPAVILIPNGTAKKNKIVAISIVLFHAGLGILTTPLMDFLLVFSTNAILIYPLTSSSLIVTKTESLFSWGRKFIIFEDKPIHKNIIRGLLTYGLLTSIITSIYSVIKVSPTKWLADLCQFTGTYQNWSMFAPEAPHSNWWVEIHGKSRDPSKKITNVINPAFETFTVPKNSISYYGTRIGFSFFTYNFHPDENESLAKKREEIVKTTLFYYCSKYSDQFSAIDLNYLTTPIDIEGTKHKLSGKIKREHLGTLNCEKLKMEKEPLIPSDEYISKK